MGCLVVRALKIDIEKSVGVCLHWFSVRLFYLDKWFPPVMRRL